MSTNDDLMLDVSQAHELKMAFRRNGWTNGDIKTLSEGNILTSVLDVIRDNSCVISKEELSAIHIIDTRTKPKSTTHHAVMNHISNGLLKWDLSKISLFASKEFDRPCELYKELCDEFDGSYPSYKKISNKSLANARVAEYLLVHPDLIPEEWKEYSYILFLGTICYCPFDAAWTEVPVIYWDKKEMVWKYDYSNTGFPTYSYGVVIIN
ncbi:TPA: hypothetical protein DIC38_02935 [Candidatus Nomurabacteria bacterium]|nr:MAG: hypothetical protein O210_OD1C00001G0198 [Parcubacteria bacterium RAAC4_OD1_1]HCY26608.1 hypothetical protein [Candidatus Nomurabacteria bacterium]